ncbi:hypothetical protein ACOSQ4_023186 [Xanthoceras sorbifolium]
MKTRKSVVDYFSRTMAITDKIWIHGDPMEDITIIEKILRLMSSKFNYVLYSIKESKDIDKLSIDELQSSLLIHEQNKEEQTLQASTNSKSACGEKGKWKGKTVHHKS